MIAFVGDIHGNVETLTAAIIDADRKGCKTMIQVGDFGLYPKTYTAFQCIVSPFLVRLGITLYWIEGNHEWFDYYEGKTGVTEMFPNMRFVPRGTCITIDGRKVAFLGGSASPDKVMQGSRWDARENITHEQVSRLDDVESCDFLITHTPPQSVIDAHFDPLALQYFGLPPTWRDPGAGLLQGLWERLHKPMLVCGHMHRAVKGPRYRILDIGEVVVL